MSQTIYFKTKPEPGVREFKKVDLNGSPKNDQTYGIELLAVDIEEWTTTYNSVLRKRVPYHRAYVVFRYNNVRYRREAWWYGLNDGSDQS